MYILLVGGPFAEFVILRVLLRELLRVRIGFVGITDYDIVPPAILAGLATLYTFHSIRPLKLRFSARWLAFHLFMLSLFLIPPLAGWATFAAGSLPYWLWFVTGVVFVASSPFIFCSPAYFLNHPRRALLWPALGICLCKVVGVHVLHFLWEPAGRATGLLTFWLAKTAVPQTTLALKVVGDSTYTQLVHPLYVLAIGSGCSGLEGIFFFIFGWLFVRLFKHQYRGGTWLRFLIAGIAGMYLLNLARLFFLFNVALFSMSYFGQSVTVRLLLGLLHSSIGWVIYSAGFVYIYRRYVLAHSPLLSGERAFVYSSSRKTFLLLVFLFAFLKLYQ